MSFRAGGEEPPFLGQVPPEVSSSESLIPEGRSHGATLRTMTLSSVERIEAPMKHSGVTT